jgi:hypothetical protein
MEQIQEYWDAFYASKASSTVPVEPSPFALWARSMLALERPLMEFGFGTARDSLWFARQGYIVNGYDFAESAVNQARGRAHAEGLAATFTQLDLYDEAAVEIIAKSIADAENRPAIYGRFLIHSLKMDGRHTLFNMAATGLAGGGDLYLEFRTGLDEATHHVFGEDHYRVYLDPEVVVTELVERGASIAHIQSGTGLAVYKSEDPHVARIVASWE